MELINQKKYQLNLIIFNEEIQVLKDNDILYC